MSMSTSEERLLQLLREAMKGEATQVTSMTGFAELGLDSLAGLRFVRKAQDSLGMDIELEWLFDHPNVAELAKFLDARRVQTGQRTDA